MDRDAQEAAFNDSFVELMGTANDARIEWALQYLWHFHRGIFIRWFNGHFFKANDFSVRKCE